MLVYRELEESFQAVFNDPDHLGNAATCQVILHQGTPTVAECSADLTKLVTDSAWNKMSLQGVFFHGLRDYLKDELALRPPTTLAQTRGASLSYTHSSVGELKQLGYTRVTPDECFCRIRGGECLHCGKIGQFVSAYTLWPKDQVLQ